MENIVEMLSHSAPVLILIVANWFCNIVLFQVQHIFHKWTWHGPFIYKMKKNGYFIFLY